MAFKFKNANQHDYATDSQAMQRIFAAPIRLLEFNRPAHSPWLAVPLAEEEIVLLASREFEVSNADEGWDE